jgi:microcystin degradation protein MlrC/D-serine deaminase-like pyridoxal phosphate-dependent protein
LTASPRVFIAGLFHETHTFLDGQTTWDDFHVLRGADMLAVRGDSSPLGGVLEAAEQFGWSVCPSLIASASPGAIVSDEVYYRYWNELSTALAESEREAPIDAVFLVLHGAMTCESIDDVEGNLLEQLAEHLRPRHVPVFGVYDLHANFTQRMASSADCLVAYRQNPHADARESAIRAVHLLERSLRTGDIPRTLLAQPPLMWPPTGTGTSDDPMRALLLLARQLQREHPAFWEVNVNAGFSFADTPDTGVSFTVVTTGDDAPAQQALQRLSDLAVRLAPLGNVVERPVDDVLRELPREAPGLTVLAEPSDNIGGGAPGDCTGLLRSLIAHSFQNSAVCLCDPQAVSTLQACQPGDHVTLPLGGRGSRLDPGPLTLEVRLVRTCDGLFELRDRQSHLASMVGDRFDMGDCAVVQHAGITILLTSRRTPPMDLGQWLHAGINPADFSYVGVKAAVAHRRAWDTISRRNVWVATPGPCASDLTQFPYTKIRRPIYPLDALPEAPAPADWYQISNAPAISSPAVLVYPDRIRRNLQQMIELAGGADRLRPHVKTHKLPQIIQLKRELGIHRFKVTTIAEAEMTAAAGGEDVLMAMQPVGPNIQRLIRLIRTFPGTHFAALVDDPENLLQISQAAVAAQVSIPLYVDLDVGMHRTGMAPGPAAAALYRALCNTPGVRAEGLHAYDGHLQLTDAGALASAAELAFAPVWKLRDELLEQSLPVPRVVASGTPTFRLTARHPQVEVGCGTTVLWDFGQALICPDLHFLHAAVLLTRVISKPVPDRLCLDLGHKAVASEMPQPRVQLFGLEDAEIVGHSEEHLVVRTSRAAEYRVGDVVYGLPRHVCPTMALHNEVWAVRDGTAQESWPVTARARRITI